MSNGRIWTSADTATLERMHGQPDRVIAATLDQPIWKVREWRQARGIPGRSGRREGWSRRDALLNDAAGLDFSPAL